MGVTVDEYIPFEAKVNHDGTVDVLIDGAPVTGATGMAMKSVLELMARHAVENGRILMTTTHPTGRVTQDLISETGEVTPFYPQAETKKAVQDPAVTDPTQEALLQVLKQQGRRRMALPEIEAAAPVESAPETARVILGAGSIPQFNVEADIQKALTSKNPPASTKHRVVVAVILTVLVLAVVAIFGMPLLTAASHMIGAMPPAGVSEPGPLQL